jgi:hypothetical protein
MRQASRVARTKDARASLFEQPRNARQLAGGDERIDHGERRRVKPDHGEAAQRAITDST